MVKLLQPQEIEVFYVLPALRRELAVCMKESGKPQKEIARLLGVTGAAVSQYLSAKRASHVAFTDTFKGAFRESANCITDEASMLRETQRLLQLARNERLMCRVHESLGNVPKGCNVCFEDG